MAEPVALSQRLPALDGVRGLAILGVLIYHGWPDLSREISMGGWLNKMAAVGPFGVDLFFVLSGFLITGVLLQTRDSLHYFRNFYARRVLRLFPVYYLYLLLVMIGLPLLHALLHTTMPQYGGSWWWYLAYASNWKDNYGVGDPELGHFWSLAVEEQFYVVWPAVVLLVGGRRLTWMCAVLIVSATALRVAWSLEGVDWNRIYRLTATRWDTLAFGALTAVAVRSSYWRPSLRRTAPAIMMCGLVGFALLVWYAGGPEWDRPLIQSLGPCMTSIGFAGLVAHAALRSSGGYGGILLWAPLVSLGKYSYFIYVIHMVVISHVYWVAASIAKHLPNASVLAPLGAFVVANVIIILLARVSWRAFEEPILRLKRYF